MLRCRNSGLSCWWLAFALALLGCGSSDVSKAQVEAVDGIIVVTLDTLRADRLSGYGYSQPTSPFLDEFADESVVFDHAFVQYPSTLASHMSIFTGLYPQQHGVVERDRSLSPAIPLIAQVFAEAGFRTAGFTENGMIAPGSGLGRGFEQFVHEHIGPPQGPDRVFDLGLEFLDGLGPGERPFLWLHTYAVHTPYEPTPDNRRTFLRGHPAPEVPVDGEYLTRVNRGLAQVSAQDVEAMSRLYDGQLRDVDAAFGRLLAALEERGWEDRLAVVVFADHGEEFHEHGHMVHEQIYPELVHIPLIIRNPRLSPRRVGAVVEAIDIAPTLAQLAGLDWQSAGAGRSLLPLATGQPTQGTESAYAETEIGIHQRTMIERVDGDLWQLIEHRFPVGQDGVWFSTSAAFDLPQADKADLQVIAYRKPRRATVRINGGPAEELALTTEWRTVPLDLPPDCFLCRVSVEVEDCERPVDVGESTDQRCLAFKVRGEQRWRYELYNLSEDPSASVDLLRSNQPIFRRLMASLRAMPREALQPPGAAGEPANEEILRSLGYL